MNHPPTYVRIFSLIHKVRGNCHFLDHPPIPNPMSLRNIKMAPKKILGWHYRSLISSMVFFDYLFWSSSSSLLFDIWNWVFCWLVHVFGCRMLQQVFLSFATYVYLPSTFFDRQSISLYMSVTNNHLDNPKNLGWSMTLKHRIIYMNWSKNHSSSPQWQIPIKFSFQLFKNYFFFCITHVHSHYFLLYYH